MSNINAAAKIASAASDVNQFDSTLIANISRLISIADMIYDEYKEDIFEIFVSPIDMLQEQMYDLDKITLYIHYDLNTENVHKWKADCKEFINEIFRNEYGNNVNIGKPKFITQSPTDKTLLLKTFLSEPVNRAEETYSIMYSIINEIDAVGAISLSMAYEHEIVHTMILHVTNFSELLYIDKVLKSFGERCNRDFIPYNDEKAKPGKNSVVYLPVLGLAPLEYDIPYQYYDRQLLEEIINAEGDNDGNKSKG